MKFFLHLKRLLKGSVLPFNPFPTTLLKALLSENGFYQYFKMGLVLEASEAMLRVYEHKHRNQTRQSLALGFDGFNFNVLCL